MKNLRTGLIRYRAWWVTVLVAIATVLVVLSSSQVGAVPNRQGLDVTVYLPIIIRSGGTVGATLTPTPTPCTPSAIGTVGVGSDPYGSASDELDEVFVANYGDGTVSVLQGAAVVGTIVGFSQPYGVAYNPVNDRMYVTDEGTGELVIVDPGNHTIVKRLGGSANPRGVGIDRATGIAYVASPGTEGTGTVRVYTLADVENDLQGTRINSVGVGPSWVAVDSETHKAYVTLQGEANYGLAVIDGAVGGYPVTYVGLNTPGAFGITYNQTNRRLYVASGTGSTLSVVDVTKIGSEQNPVIAALKTSPEYNLDTLAVNPDTGHVFVTGRRELTAKVWVLDSNTNTWLDDPFNVGSYNSEDPFLRGVSFDPVQGWFYVSSEYTDQVYLFDDCGGGGPTPTPTPTTTPSTDTPTPTATTTHAACYPVPVGTPVPVSANPYGSASDEVNEIFVANHGSGTVSVLQGDAVVGSISIGEFSQPYGVAYNPVNDRIYVTDEGTGELVIIDPVSHDIVKRLGGLANPRGVGIDRVTGSAYVTSPGTDENGNMRVYTVADVSNPTPSEGTLINSIGPWPSWVVVDSETHKAYVTLNGTTEMAVVEPHWDGTTLTYPFDVVNLNTERPFGIALNETSHRLYVASETASTLTVWDVSGDPTLVDALKTDPEYNLDTVTVNPDSGRVFVTGRQGVNSKMWVLDGNTNTWNTSYDIGSNPSGNLWRGTTYDPVRKWLYVSNDSEGKVYVFDDSWGPPCPDTGPWTPSPTPEPCYPKAVGTPVAVGLRPYGSAADGSGKVFVANHGKDGGDGSISVLQGSQIVATIGTVNQPYGVAYNPMNNRIYVTDEGNGELLIINPDSYAIEKRLGGVANPRGVAIDLTTGDAYVASPGTEGHGAVKKYTQSDVDNETQGQPAVSVGGWPTWIVVDSQSRAHVTTGTDLVTITGTDTSKQGLVGSFGIAYNRDTETLYTASGVGATLAVWDVSGAGDPVFVLDAPKTDPEYSLDAVTMNPTSSRVFVTGRRNLTSKLWVLDGNTNTWLTTNYTVGSYDLEGGLMRGISYNVQNGYVYVSNEFFNKVYIFDDNGSPVCP